MKPSADRRLVKRAKRLTMSLIASISSIRERPMLLFGLAVPLSMSVLADSGGFASGIPTIVPVTAILAVFSLFSGGLKRIMSAWRAAPAAFWLYALVCAIEACLMFYHRSPEGLTFLAGRLAFFGVMLTTVANCADSSAVEDGLKGLTVGIAVIALLTVVHALGIAEVPSAWPGTRARVFGPIRMPFPRTLGLRMTYNKFGVLASVALTTAMVPLLWTRSRTWSVGIRVVLSLLVLAAALISQTRGVYLTTVAAMALAGGLLLVKRRRLQWLTTDAGAWGISLGYALLLVLAHVLFPAVAPDWVLNVGSEGSVVSVVRRFDQIALGWHVLKESPLLGIGHGVFPDLFSGKPNIHSHFWEHVVSAGLVGSIPYLLFHLLVLVLALRLLRRARSPDRPAAIVLVASICGTYLAYQFFLGFFTSVFAVVCGLVLSLQQSQGCASTDCQETAEK